MIAGSPIGLSLIFTLSSSVSETPGIPQVTTPVIPSGIGGVPIGITLLFTQAIGGTTWIEDDALPTAWIADNPQN